ncbi:MAG TPA: hypothetical protein VK714_01925 [Myxococcota bacterium]|nr:hypothetical protein [Myxococcota bacterium]
MEPKKDSANHYVRETWRDGPGIRLAASQPGGRAELPIPDKATAFDLFSAIQRALDEKGFKGEYAHS